MASLQELKQVVRETLESRGVMSRLRAEVRGEVFRALDDPIEQRPQLSRENLLINELIYEYLEFNKYKYAASVLRAESGQTNTQPLDREFLARELNVVENRNTAEVPLLYSIVGHFADRTEREKPPRNQLS